MQENKSGCFFPEHSVYTSLIRGLKTVLDPWFGVWRLPHYETHWFKAQ